jgi:hypothetical protein
MTDQIAAITIRRLDESDSAALSRLAQLDSGSVPEGAVLGAEVEGRLLAAVSLADGASVADPFSRTTELRAMIELRAAQLRRREAPRHGLRSESAGRSRGALAGSVPGAGGRLLTLIR